MVALAALLAAGPASAFGIVFDGPTGFGISAASAAGAEADGVPIIVVPALSTAASLGMVIPAPDVLSFDLNNNPSVANPNTATSRWTVNNTGAGLTDSWLVFLNPTNTPPYTASNVGFEIEGSDGWALFQVAFQGTDYFYPAKFLGDVPTNDAVDFLMHHLVGQALFEQGGQFVLPQYGVAGVQGLPVPEPAALGLLAVGVALAVSAKRRNA